MGVAKVTQKLFKADFAIGLIFNGINFESAVLEFFSAVSAYKTFRMEFVTHGRHCPASDEFATDITVVSGPVGFVNGHFFQKCSAEHFGHIFLLKGFLQDAQAAWNACTCIAHLHVPIRHPRITNTHRHVYTFKSYDS